MKLAKPAPPCRLRAPGRGSAQTSRLGSRHQLDCIIDALDGMPSSPSLVRCARQAETFRPEIASLQTTPQGVISACLRPESIPNAPANKPETRSPEQGPAGILAGPNGSIRPRPSMPPRPAQPDACQAARRVATLTPAWTTTRSSAAEASRCAAAFPAALRRPRPSPRTRTQSASAGHPEGQGPGPARGRSPSVTTPTDQAVSPKRRRRLHAAGRRA